MRKSPLNDFTSFLIECLNRALYHDTDRQGVSGTFLFFKGIYLQVCSKVAYTIN
jgi:hypothetical protein